MLTVVLTGLYVRSPSARRAPDTPAVTLTVGEPRTINLVFGARTAIDDVELTVITLAALERELGRASWMRTFVTALAERFLDVDRELSRVRAEQDR